MADSNKDIRTCNGVFERSIDGCIEIREKRLLLVVKVVPTATNNTLAIYGENMRFGVTMQKLDDSSACRASAYDYDLAVGKIFTRYFCGIDESCERDDRRAMLIVVKNRDIEFAL